MCVCVCVCVCVYKDVVVTTVIINRVQQSLEGLIDRAPGRVVQVVARAVSGPIVVAAVARDRSTLHSRKVKDVKQKLNFVQYKYKLQN